MVLLAAVGEYCFAALFSRLRIASSKVAEAMKFCRTFSRVFSLGGCLKRL